MRMLAVKCFVLVIAICGLFVDGMVFGAGSGLPRPNIVWIVVEDMSCDFGYQGQKLVKTPNVDRLAKEGAVFSNAYVTAPVCSPCRSAMITGMYQTAIGAHHHRSGRGTVKIRLAEHIKLIPEMFKQAGYYTINTNQSFKGYGKTDYNFVFDNKAIYDRPDLSQRKPGQSFFMQVHLRGGKLRHGKSFASLKSGLDKPVTADQVSLPPYYPDDPVFRKDWADYLNTVQYTDKEVGQILQRLKKEKLLDNTVLIFITDHGISQARGKQFLYDEGVKIPFIVWAPGRIKGDTVRDEMVAHIDMAATSLYFAGIEIPDYMQARTLFGPNAKPREYVVSGRDRCDETVDRIRSVVKGNYKYIRNFYPKRPYLQPCVYKDYKPFMKQLRKLHADGKLNKVQLLHLAESRPKEELFDLSADKWEVNNLAGKAEYKDKLAEMRGILDKWVVESDDKGRVPESDAMYDSDMKVYLGGSKRRGRTEYAKELEGNIKLMKKWKAEGK